MNLKNSYIEFGENCAPCFSGKTTSHSLGKWAYTFVFIHNTCLQRLLSRAQTTILQIIKKTSVK